MNFYSLFKVRYKHNPNTEVPIAVINGEHTDSYINHYNIESYEPASINANIESFSNMVISTKADRKPFTLFVNTMLPYYEVFTQVHHVLEESPVQLTFMPDLVYMYNPDPFWFADLSKIHAYERELRRVKACLSRYNKKDVICVTGVTEHCAHLLAAIDTVTMMQESPEKYPNFDADELKILVELALPELKKHYAAFKQYQKNIYSNPNKDIYVVDIHSTNIVSSISNMDDYYLLNEINNTGKQSIHLANMLHVDPEAIDSLPIQIMEYLMAVLQGFQFLTPPLHPNHSSI